MIKKILLLVIIVLPFILSSCSEEKSENNKPTSTVLMFFPWGNNTYSAFLRNISNMKSAVEESSVDYKTDILIWIADSKTTAKMIRLKKEGSVCVSDTLKSYTNVCPSGSYDYTTTDGLSSIFGEMKQAALAKSFSLIIGSHGTGWIPRGCSFESSAAKRARRNLTILTRWWGATSSLPSYCIEVESLANALERNDMYMDYIYFDACYMGGVEVAYQLRGVTHYLMASAAELLLAGSPFTTVGKQLLSKNYSGAIDEFYNHYKSVNPLCATMSLIDCTALDSLASIVRQIYASTTPNKVDVVALQSFDGISSHVFYDLSDYIKSLNPSSDLLATYNEAMSKAVIHCVNTESVISMYNGNSSIKINCYCGLTTTAPSYNTGVAAINNTSEWWQATH